MTPLICTREINITDNKGNYSQEYFKDSFILKLKDKNYLKIFLFCAGKDGTGTVKFLR
jgi:hypothetical protein